MLMHKIELLDFPEIDMSLHSVDLLEVQNHTVHPQSVVLQS